MQAEGPTDRAPTAPRRSFGPPRRLWLGAVTALAAAPLAWLAVGALAFPSDRTPEGAYYRIGRAVNEGRPQAAFAYLETAAQHSCYTLRDYRKKSRELVLADYPEPERSELAESWREEAEAPDGADVFAIWARRRGWMDRLRRDLSGVKKVEVQGDRATLETVRGTRYAFRRRENGIWGLTLFTAALVAEAERAARDHGQVERAAADHRRVRDAETTPARPR